MLLVILKSGVTVVWQGMMFLVCVCAAGALVVARLSDDSWFIGKWGHSDVVEPVSGGHGGCCSLFGSVPGPLQTVHRAEFRSVVV